MKRLSIVSIIVLLAFGAFGRLAGSQSLADVAKQEREKKKEQQKKPAKTYTNADLDKITGGNVSSVSTGTEPTATAGEESKAEGAGEGAAGESSAAAAGEQSATGGEGAAKEEQGEAYWRKRAADARLDVSKTKERVDLLLLKQRTLTNDFYNLSDPAQRDLAGAQLQRLAGEIEDARSEAATAQQNLGDVMTEGRKAGALPGWLRE